MLVLTFSLSFYFFHGGEGMVVRDRVSLCSVVNRLASNSQNSTCLCLPSAGIKGVRHHHRAKFEIFIIQPHFWSTLCFLIMNKM